MSIPLEPPGKLISNRAVPWATVAIAAAACLALALPAVSGWLIYERSLILHGQLWRTITGHVVHHGGNHFFWNLAVFLPIGCWLERWWPVETRWFYAVCPLFISVSLLLFDPSLVRYAGLSGVATGAIVLLACFHLRIKKQAEPVWFWYSVLGLVGVKIVFELIKGAPLLVSGFVGIRNVPLAHISGVVCGILFSFWKRSAGTGQESAGE